MINNKIISIEKNNQFDKGWTLFKQYDLGIRKNREFHEIMMSDIIKGITHSDVVDLVLCEPCLSSRIINEIEWANKYIKLNIIAKNKDIIKRYSNLTFNSQLIDDSIDFNYIGIIGKQNGFYMISDTYIEVDDSLEKVYFQKKNLKGDYSFLNKVREIIIINQDAKKDYSEILAVAQKEKIECVYAVDTKYYDRAVFDFAKSKKIDLVVSNYTYNGVVLVNKDDTLSCLSVLKDGFFVTYPIETLSAYLGQEYKCCFYNDQVKTKELVSDFYSCYKGKLRKLEIVDTKVVPIEINVKLMSDFVEEKFDSTIVESHNDYSAEATKVDYQFTLIPPMIDKSYVESKVYDGVHSLKEKWDALQTLNTGRINRDYKMFLSEDFGLLDFLKESERITSKLDNMVDSCNYRGFYSQMNDSYDLFDLYNKNLIDVCKQMFKAINKESSGTKFDKFDDEIAGYEQTIKEKNALIEKGIDVLSNKRRVEILTKKINDLLELKKHFEGSSSSRDDKSLLNFENRCNKVISSGHIDSNNDSIGNIVKPKEETKTSKLESFVDQYLFSIKKYIEDCIEVLKELKRVHIPEDYPVYDKEEQRYIVINDLSEYEKTKALCDEFSLKCITRR